MMKRFMLVLISVLLISVMLPSCFEITESLSVNKDGSGTFSMTIDLSKMKEMVEAFSNGDESATSPVAEMEDDFHLIKIKLGMIEGISNVDYFSENDGYIVTTSFDFEDFDALNTGINVVYEDVNSQGVNTEYYKYKKRSFERTDAHNILEELKGEMFDEQTGGEDIDLSEIFSDVVFNNVVTFTDMKIRKTSSDALEVSEDESTLILKSFVFSEDEEISLDYKLKVR